jgi:hypothetical protein
MTKISVNVAIDVGFGTAIWVVVWTAIAFLGMGDQPKNDCDLILGTLSEKLSDRPAKHMLLQHPGICGFILRASALKLN